MCNACVLVQEAKSKNISNYELSTIYRRQANAFIMQSKGLNPLTPVKSPAKSPARRKRRHGDDDYVPRSSGESSEDDDPRPKRKSTRKQSSPKNVVDNKEPEAADKRKYLHTYLCFVNIRTCVSTQVGAVVSLRYSHKLLRRTCLRRTTRNSPTTNLSPLRCTFSWNVCLRFAYLLACVLVVHYHAYLRALQVYIRQWNNNGKSESHECRQQLLTNAVEVVQKHQVNPANSGPFGGNCADAVKTALPLIEKALVMPKKLAARGSKVTFHAYLCFLFMRTCVT